MSWTKKQIAQHQQAAQVLDEIIRQVAEYIKNNPATTDVELRQFIKKQYKKHNLVSDKQGSIVAFGHNTSFVHFYAEKPRQLKQGDLIMVDIWARLAKIGAPFADITWMLYYGKDVPARYAKVFGVVAKARDKAVKLIVNNLKKQVTPAGRVIDAAVRRYLNKYGHGDKFLHSTGHSLGFVGPHGRRTRISRKGRRPLPLKVGYTIEPGVYFKGEFGIRSEIDFYIHENYKIIITTICQKQITRIWKKN